VRHPDDNPDHSAAPSATASAGTTDVSSADLSEVPTRPGARIRPTVRTGSTCSNDSGIVRSDIRSSFGSSTTTAEGGHLRSWLTFGMPRPAMRSSAAPCTSGLQTVKGQYSLYQQRARGTRTTSAGAQPIGADGSVRSPRSSGLLLRPVAGTSTSRCIRCRHRGRIRPIREDVADRPPKETCTTVLCDGGYEQSVRNLAQSASPSDNVFSATTRASTRSRRDRFGRRPLHAALHHLGSDRTASPHRRRCRRWCCNGGADGRPAASRSA